MPSLTTRAPIQMTIKWEAASAALKGLIEREQPAMRVASIDFRYSPGYSDPRDSEPPSLTFDVQLVPR